MKINTPTLKVGSLVLAVTLSMTACNKPAEEAPKTEVPIAAKIVEPTTEDNSEEAEKESEEAEVTAESLLARMAVDTASMSLEGMTSAGVLDEPQTECVKAIELKSQVPMVQGFINKSFNEAERKELIDFYLQPGVQAVTDFGREQMLAMMGLPIEAKAPEPTEADLKKVIEFSKTATGQKFTEFNMKEGEGTMNDELSGFIMTELKKCGIDPNAEAEVKS